MRKSKWIASIICVVIALTASVACFSLSLTKKTYAAILDAPSVASSYNLGDAFDFPDEVSVNIDDKKVSASGGVLIFPSGKVCGEGTCNLTEKGEYTLSYTLVHENKKYVATKTFEVNDYNYKFSSNGSSATYGELSLSNSQETGLTFQLGYGEKFIYESTINVNDEKWNGLVDVCKIYPHIRSYDAETGLTYDTAHWMLVKMVDCYDENNYIEFYTTMNPASNYYCGAGASYQDLGGFEGVAAANATATSIHFEGKYYKVNYAKRYPWQQWQYGTYTHTEVAVYENGVRVLYPQNAETNLAAAGGINFQYEPKTNRIYRQFYSNGKVVTEFVNDLDEPLVYGDNVFTGFTTGEVYLTIECEGYTGSDTAEIQVVSLFGNSGENLAQSQCTDTTAPIIRCDVEWTDDSGIYLAVGEEYVLPDVQVYDVNFEGDLKKQVYYNYGATDQSMAYVKDGAFTPARAGKYSVVYTATDLYGNATDYVLPLNCIEKKSIDYTIQKIDALQAGSVYTLPEAVAEGINGDLQISVSVTDPSGNEVKLQNNAFEPKQVGNFTIAYTLSDNVYETVYEYTVACTNEDNCVRFYDVVNAPKYYIKGASYAIEDYYAYTVNESGLVANLCDTFVSVDGGNFVLLSATDKEEYKITGNSTIQFKYVYKTAEKLSEVISIIDVNYSGKKDYTKYFLGNYTISYDKFVRFVADGTNQTESISFINPLSFIDFEIKFQINEGYYAFSGVNVYLTDYLDETQTLKISFTKSSVKNLIYDINDCNENDLSESFVGTQWVWYDKDTNAIVSNQGVSVSVDKFTSGLCYLTIEYVGIEGTCGIALDTLNGQKFKEKISEGELLLNYEKIDPVYLVGDTVEIPVATCTHVFNPVLYKDITVTVEAPDGQPVKDVNGLTIQNVTASRSYEIVFDACGTYLIRYSAKATTGSKTLDVISIYGVNVLDDTAPEVKFESVGENGVVTISAGTKHNIAKYTASDNETVAKDLHIKVEIVTDTERLVEYDVGESYVFKNKGKYIVRVVCFDSNWNMATDEYVVIVK